MVITAVSGYGFPPEAPIIFETPHEMWLTGGDLSPLEENIDKIIFGLTEWEPEIKEKGVTGPTEKLKFEGQTFQEACDRMNTYFLRNNWADGLPIVPATDKRVEWILTGTDLPRNALIGEGKIMPRGGVASVESAAIALAMAGGRPEYLPVLLAAVEAMIDPAARHQSWIATTRSCFAVVIVNGKVAEQIRLPRGYGVMGPDPLFPAGTAIGRALALMILILGGAVPGYGTMSIYGFMKHLNAVFAEDEANMPASGWPTIAEERGFAKGSNVVTVTPAVTAHMTQFHQSYGPSMEDEQRQFLLRLAGDFGGPGLIGGYIQEGDDRYQGVCCIAATMAKMLSDMGWSKQRVVDFIRENSQPTWDMQIKYGRVAPDAEPAAINNAPPLLAIAGGDQGNQGAMMWAYGNHTTTSAEVKLPANWEELIAQSEEDLGPIPVV